MTIEKTIQIVCEDCGGAGVFSDPNFDVINCPTCNGAGRVEVAKDVLALDADSGSVLPMRINETGRDDEPLIEIIICDCISGGADYKNNMPAKLSLLRILADGTEYKMTYTQKEEGSFERWLRVEAPMDGKCRYAIGDETHEPNGTFEITRIKRVHIDRPPYVNFHVYGIEVN